LILPRRFSDCNGGGQGVLDGEPAPSALHLCVQAFPLVASSSAAFTTRRLRFDHEARAGLRQPDTVSGSGLPAFTPAMKAKKQNPTFRSLIENLVRTHDAYRVFSDPH
jgi:hypothetical protein